MEKLSKLSRSIEGKVAIITGAASGMGRATAQLFADEGAKVAAIDLNEGGLAETVQSINDAGREAKGWTLDVGDENAINRTVHEIVAHFGALNILVNNAGISRPTTIDGETYAEAWTTTMNINLTAHTRFIRAALPHLTADGAGRIVNVASTEGLGATAHNSPYTASKHGVIGLTRALAVELGSKGVTVNCVCPGPIHTGMTSAIPDDAKTKFARRRVPLRRYGDPEEVAHGTLNLVLPASSYMNAVILVVDGGMTAQNT